MERQVPASDLERRKQVRIRLRSDLNIAPQKYEGRTYYVVKDPVSLRYYRFEEQEHFIIEMMNGAATLDETQKEFEKRFRPKRLTLEDLEVFAQQLLTAGLAHNESPQAGTQLYERRKKRKRSEWVQMLTNILYIKIPVYDPDKLLARMVPYLGWIFTTWFFTLSVGFMLAAAGEPGQVVPAAYPKIHSQSMMPIAHLTWSGVWSGVAAGAVERARAFLRAAARRGGGQLPPGASHLTRATASLRSLRGMVASQLQRFEAIAASEDELERLEFQAAMNLLKVNASELALATVMSSLQACGLAGYRNDGDFSVTRHLRDILSAPIMINNDRILANAANASLLVEVPARLRD